MNAKEAERANLENSVEGKIRDIFQHDSLPGLEPHKNPYTDLQRKLFSDVINDFRQLQKIDKELSKHLEDFKEAKQTEQSLNDKSTDFVEEVNVGKEEILGEMSTIRQMAKMTCGRQGNQYPIFTREFFHCTEKGTGFRENVIRSL